MQNTIYQNLPPICGVTLEQDVHEINSLEFALNFRNWSNLLIYWFHSNPSSKKSKKDDLQSSTATYDIQSSTVEQSSKLYKKMHKDFGKSCTPDNSFLPYKSLLNSLHDVFPHLRQGKVY